MWIDTSFDFESDSGGRDPDRASQTLRSYHRFLWSKELPDGRRLELNTTSRGEYLHHCSDELGEWYFSSDAIIHSYRGWNRTRDLLANLPSAWVDEVHEAGSTIGGYLIFPSDQRDGKPTINARRGTRREISDRFDLTLECIRRHYAGASSPLSADLNRYDDFFALFGTFGNYTEFFHLQDLTTSTLDVQFWLPFDNFDRSPLPQSVDEYAHYREGTTQFATARNARIQAAHPRPARAVDGRSTPRAEPP